MKNFRTKVRLLKLALTHYPSSLSPCIPHFSYNETVTIIPTPQTFFFFITWTNLTHYSAPALKSLALQKLNLFWRPTPSYFVFNPQDCPNCLPTLCFYQLSTVSHLFSILSWLPGPILSQIVLFVRSLFLREAHRTWPIVGTEKMSVALN